MSGVGWDGMGWGGMVCYNTGGKCSWGCSTGRPPRRVTLVVFERVVLPRLLLRGCLGAVQHPSQMAGVFERAPGVGESSQHVQVVGVGVDKGGAF